MTEYATRTEAIYREIVETIEGSGEVTDARAEYDIDAIADIVLGDYDRGYRLLPEFGGLTGDREIDDDAQSMAENFWSVVADNAR